MPHISPKYEIGPVVAAAVYRNDVLVIREGVAQPGHDFVQRGDIMEISRDSLRRLAFVANNADCNFRSMMTLTYPSEFPMNGKEVKRHLDVFLKRLRRHCPGVLYLWFLEFQLRGAPHFHVLLNIGLPENPRDRQLEYKWLSRTWYKIVGSQDEYHRLAGTRLEGLRSADGGRHYAVKYAGKTYQKIIPEGFRDVGRFWGHSRALTVTPHIIKISTENEIRQSLSEWPYFGNIEQFMPRVLYNAARFWRG
jgi:hypothetical protein